MQPASRASVLSQSFGQLSGLGFLVHIARVEQTVPGRFLCDRHRRRRPNGAPGISYSCKPYKWHMMVLQLFPVRRASCRCIFLCFLVPPLPIAVVAEPTAASEGRFFLAFPQDRELPPILCQHPSYNRTRMRCRSDARCQRSIRRRWRDWNQSKS